MKTTPAAPPAVTVESIMIKDVHTINTEMTIREATKFLLQHHIAGAPVIDSAKRVITVLSEGDLLRLLAGMGLDKTIYQCLLKLTKTDKLITVKRTDPFTDVYRKFLSHSVHRLIVVDEKGKLEGLVSRSNVLRALVDQSAPAQPAATTAVPPAKKSS